MKRSRYILLTVLCIVCALALCSCSEIINSIKELGQEYSDMYNELSSALISPSPTPGITLPPSEGDDMLVHFIDVGQGDSVLIEASGEYMLIDAGENNKGTIVVDYLKSRNISSLKYVIGTHPHSDHIGGLDTVITEFNVENMILPDKDNTTKTYEDMLDVIIDKDIPVITPHVGDIYTIGKASFIIIAPVGDTYDNLNDYSVGIKLINGKNSFILNGDAESGSEAETLKAGIDLKADVYKASHHGSVSSTSDAFLDAISPEYVIIMCGKDNSYGHPHKETLDKFAQRNINVYRTDMLGSIVVKSDGTNIEIIGG